MAALASALRGIDGLPLCLGSYATGGHLGLNLDLDIPVGSPLRLYLDLRAQVAALEHFWEAALKGLYHQALGLFGGAPGAGCGQTLIEQLS